MPDILQDFQNILSERPAKTNLLECELELTTENPINTPQYPLPFKVQEIVDKDVKDMLNLDVIEAYISPYNSPQVPVKKLDNSYRV